MLMAVFGSGKLIKVIAWTILVGAIIGSILWSVNHYEAKGRSLGIAETESKWLIISAEAAEQSKKNSEEAAKILSERGKEFNQMIDAIEETNNEDKRNAELAKNMAVTAARNGTFKLYDNWKHLTELNLSRGTDQEGGLPTTTTGTDGQRRAELSAPLAAFLVGDASEADRITIKLTELQEYTRALLEACSSRFTITP
jgi:hypothetical protein